MFKALKPGVAGETTSGKLGADSLKEVQSSPLDVWRVIRILHEHPHPGVQEHVCNRLPELGEAIIERHLLQLIYLAVNNKGPIPWAHTLGAHLERILLLLCARSFRIAIKTQWLLVALCQDHPKNKTLETFREYAYTAAMEGKWEVPIRSAKLDPLSPHTSLQFSPPFQSPTNSYMASHLANHHHAAVGRERAAAPPPPPSQQYRVTAPSCIDVAVATQPPGSMVMSPATAAGAGGGLAAASKEVDDAGGGAAAALRRRSAAMQSLVCLLPPEHRAGAALPTAAYSVLGLAADQLQQQFEQQQQALAVPCAVANGTAAPTWLDERGVAALAPAVRTSAPAADAAGGAGLTVSKAASSASTTSSAFAAPPAQAAAAASGAAAHAAAAPEPARQHGAAAGAQKRIAVACNGGDTERILALKRELGEGEGVSALLERSKQQGSAPVAVHDDDPLLLLSDDELCTRPMSPLSKLRYDTFGATLDFVEALTDASASLTNYSQEDRQRALRAGLEHINGEIEKANRREVAIWFPMGRRGDRVLGLVAREAVLLNSREKAPFMLIVEVLEGQNECGDEDAGADPFTDLTGAGSADLRARPEYGTGGGSGLSASMMASIPVQKLEFGRRETYGIALTGIGAQHQLQYMHAAVPGGSLTAATAASRPAEVGKPVRDEGVSPTGRDRRAPSPRSPWTAEAAAVVATAAAAPAGPGTPTAEAAAAASPNHAGEGLALVSPMPTRPASMSQAALLEEQAAARAVAARQSGSATADGSPGASGGAASPAPVQVAPAAASEIVIPTRSASSNNIAAAAAAAMAASVSGGGSEPMLSASARSSDAGALCGSAAAATTAACGGAVPQTPRCGSSFPGLPPRPPSSSSHQQPHQQAHQQQLQQQLPVGGISPINAAKEVSSCSPGEEGGGLLSSNLLRRILGDRPEMANPPGSGGVGGASGGEGQIGATGVAGVVGPSGVKPAVGDVLAIAATVGGPQLPTSAGLTAEPRPAAPKPPPRPPPPAAAGLQHGSATRPAPALPRFGGLSLMEGKLQELTGIGVGVFSSPRSQGQGRGGRSEPEVMEMLSHISASLRGEMPMIRVKIVPIGGDASTGSGGNVGGGGAAAAASPSAPSALLALGSRAKAALLNQTQPQQQQPASQPPTPQLPYPQPLLVPDDAGEGGPSKAIAILSRLMRRKPAAEDDTADAASAAPAPPPPAVTIPVTSGGGGGGASTARYLQPLGPGAAEPRQRLVRLILTLPTQFVNLDIKSPHRKSRRTPSHEAIEMMADKYKVHKLPPPPECGPPLGPAHGTTCGSGTMDRVVERASEEGEGEAAEAGAAEAAAKTRQRLCPRDVAAAVASIRPEMRATVAAETLKPEAMEVAATADGPDALRPLPPQWEAWSPRALHPTAAASLAPPPAAPWSAGLEPPQRQRSGGANDSSPVKDPGPPPASPAEKLPCAAEPWVSQPMAVAEGTAAKVAAAAPGPAVAQGLGGDGGCRPTGCSLDAGPEAGPGLAMPASAAPGLAASLHSSLARMLNRSSQQLPSHSQQLAQPSTEDVSSAGGRGGPAGAALAAEPSDTVGSDAGSKPAARLGLPAFAEAGDTGVSGQSASGLAASLQSSLTRIFNRNSAGQQQPSSSEVGGGSSNDGGGGGSHSAGPRGVSPVRGGCPAQASPASAAAALAGMAPPEAQSSSGLAASLHSSLTRMLNRSATNQSLLQQQQQNPAEGPTCASAGGVNPLGRSPRGVSPVRGSAGSAVGDAAAAAVSTAATATSSAANGPASCLSKLLGRLQPDQAQPPPPQQHSTSSSLLPAPASAQPAQQQPPQGQGHGRPMPPSRSFGNLRGELAAAEAAAAEAAVAPRPLSRTTPHGLLPRVTDGRTERESLEERRRREAHAVYGERWGVKARRIQRESPHGRRKGWALRCVIVKSGDDCRQELLALQLVRTFGDIFTEAGLPLWVRHYEILVTSNKTALIEMVPNTLSVHTIKSRSPPGTSLSDHFFARFGRSGGPECLAAQRRFTESLAAYSLICYLLQIKDRHNGNILIDDDGRVVHIDYGFLLSNSPGGVNFEAAPFKLTRELLEVMDSNSDGRPSEMFDYFKVLMIQGFIAARAHSDRILLLVRVMARSGFPCFKGGERAIRALEKRFMCSLSEVQCVEHVLQLIAESLDAWRTRQYDYYQRVLNGIL